MMNSKLFTGCSAAALTLFTIVLPAPAWADSTPECNIGMIDDPGPDGFFGTPDDVQLGTTECGAFSNALGKNSTAIGVSAVAFEPNSTAIGENSSASAPNSVALGSGSRADQANTVSVGSVFSTRRITNVSAGTQLNDAANVGQMDAGDAATLSSANAYTDTRENAIRDDIAAGDAATLVAANGYTDTREAAIRADIVAAGATALADANAYTDTRETAIRGDMTVADDRIEGLATTAQQTADTAIGRGDALGASTASALGGGSSYNAATGAVSAPSYMIGGQSYANVGSALDAVDDRLGQIDARIDVLNATSDRRFRHANGGIAAAMAVGGTMIVPDSTVSMNFNLATFRGEQGFSGAVVVRASPRVYISGGFAGSTVKGSTGGRVGVAFGF